MTRTTMIFTAIAAAVLAALAAGGGCDSPVDQAAEKQFRAKLGSVTVTVFPAYLRDLRGGAYDDPAAVALKTFLEGQKLATAFVSDAHVPLTGRPGMNQSKMLRYSLAEFTAWLREHPVSTDYAMLPEYLIDGQGRGIGVHLYVLTADGRCAYAILLNSHHEPFQKVNPQNPADCTQIVIDVMRAELTREGSAN